jgi:BirA family biotin operon repressor/biotin-[acetyl-CoA-carboxylase] ligase
VGNDSPGGPGSPWTDLTRPPLRVAALRRALLGRGGPWTSLDVVTSTGSTNADLAAAAATGTAGAGAVLVAEHQVAGRGRRDRVWVAPPRSSLAVSVLLVPDRVPQARWSWLPLLVGVGVASALAEVAGVQTGLKWPNDVLARMRGAEHGVPGADDLPDGDDGAPDDDSGAPDPADDPAAWHKVCGILAEVVALPDDTSGASARRGVVIGIGLNVGQRADELPAQGPGGLPAGSLTTLGASTTDRDTVLRSVLRAVGELYETWIEQ